MPSNKSSMYMLLRSLRTNLIGSGANAPSPSAFLRSFAQHPSKFYWKNLIETLPIITFPDLFEMADEDYIVVRIGIPPLRRHDWNVRLDEEILLGEAARRLHARRIFEFGTFDGNTTLRLAEEVPDSEIVTLDMPKDVLDQMNMPNFKGDNIGERFRGTPQAQRITQIHCMSTQFDPTPYLGSFDMIFVDAAHDYRHLINDTKLALQMIRPGGLIFWHDFIPDWGALVEGVVDAMEGRPLYRLNKTSLAVHRAV